MREMTVEKTALKKKLKMTWMLLLKATLRAYQQQTV